MREFVSDLFYMCSSSNDKSRGFYIFVTIILAILTIAIPVMLGVLIFTIVKGGSIVLPIILTIAAIAIYIAVIVWLKKS